MRGAAGVGPAKLRGAVGASVAGQESGAAHRCNPLLVREAYVE